LDVAGGQAKQDMLSAHYTKYKAEKNETSYRNSSVYRFFFPYDASYDIKGANTARTAPEDRFDPAKGYYPTYTNDFRDHHQD